MTRIEHPRDLLPGPRTVLIALGIVALSFVVARSNYLLFHMVAEGFAIMVAILIYVVGTRTYRHSGDSFLLFLGNAYLFIAVIDFLHTLTYQGMGVFQGYTSDTPTQLWIAGRYLDALSLLAASFFIGRQFSRSAAFWIYATTTTVLISSIMVFRVFPTAFIPGQGLTPFKVGSEYVICVILLAGIWHLRSRSAEINRSMYLLMVAAMSVTIASELSFTLYSDVYGVMNLVGHLFKILAYYLVYRGVVLRGLEAPYLEVKMLNEGLERRVLERTAELRVEIAHREQAQAEREELLAALEVERARLAAVLDQMPAGVIIAEAGTGRILLANEQMGRILRAPAVVWTTVEEYAAGGTRTRRDGSAYAPEEWPLVRSMSAGEVVAGEEMFFLRGDGTRGAISVSSAPIRDETGRIVAGVVVNLEITERVQAEEQRDDYVRAISHDLRNPLTSVHGHAEVLIRRLQRQGLSGEQRSAEAILASAKLMNEMIQELAEVAQLESGALQLNLTPVDLPAFASDLKQRIAGPGEGERITVKAASELPPVMADPDRLERILRNLLSNALKYSPPDSEVTVAIRRQNGHVLTAVEDRGHGIAPEEMNNLFQRYYRTKAARNAEASGLGLGLYITKGLVEAHGGHLWAQSEPQRGSTFSFTLPC